MHQKISEVTILTIVISTILLILLGSVIIYFLFAYQRKGFRHHAELLLLNQQFNRTLLQSKLEIQEQTLNHISKELHANISHLTSVININLSAYLAKFPGEVDENILESKLLVKQLMADIKSLSVTLNSEHIAKAGFLKMLERELERLKKTRAYVIKFAKEGQSFRLPPETEIILFRLSQEILNNIVRHAAASAITVDVRYQNQLVYLTITDDGCGFDIALVQKNAIANNSTGLSNIYSRSAQINSQVAINSTVGRGTSITVTVPV